MGSNDETPNTFLSQNVLRVSSFEPILSETKVKNKNLNLGSVKNQWKSDLKCCPVSFSAISLLKCLEVRIYGALSTAWNRKEALERSIVLYKLHANGNADYISFKVRHFVNRIRPSFWGTLVWKTSQTILISNR